MQLAPDAVADKFLHDRQARSLDMSLHRSAEVAQPTPLHHLLDR